MSPSSVVMLVLVLVLVLVLLQLWPSTSTTVADAWCTRCPTGLGSTGCRPARATSGMKSSTRLFS